LVDNGAVVIEVSYTSVAVLAVRCERGSIDFTGFTVATLVDMALLVEKIFILRDTLRFQKFVRRICLESFGIENAWISKGDVKK